MNLIRYHKLSRSELPIKARANPSREFRPSHFHLTMTPFFRLDRLGVIRVESGNPGISFGRKNM